MKKVLALVIMLCILLSLCACGNTPVKPNAANEQTAIAEESEDSAAEAAEEDTAETKKESNWVSKYYVDSFNQPVLDAWYVSGYAIGEFSNSATTDSNLIAFICVDAEDVCFMLYEYARSQVKNSSSRYAEEYSITMRTTDGVDHSLSAVLPCGSDRLYVDDSNKEEVLTALKGGEDVSFYIVENDSPTTNYLFTLPTADFADEYAKHT